MFTVILKECGERLCFNGKCNEVDYSNERMVVFKNVNGRNFITLAIIPTDNILVIINHVEEDAK